MSVSAGERPELRLFTGLDVPPGVSANLASLVARLRPSAPLRWSPLANLHITTKFIGNLSESRLDDLNQALANVARGSAIGFTIEIRGLGWHPNPHHPHVFFAAVHGGDGLGALHRATGDAVAPIGVPKETKPYAPHLTLARVPSNERINLAPIRQAIAALESVDFGNFVADRFFLFRSDPASTGSIYTKLGEFPL